MKVILNQDVDNLGEEGDICEVARGYARNYLLPRGLGLQYNNQNIAQIEQRRAAIEKHKDEKRKAAMGVKQRLEGEELVFTMASGEKGQLFGSVNSQGIAERLESMGVDVERRKIDVPDGTIKSLGRHSVKVKLYGGEEAVLTVVVSSDASSEKGGAKEKSEESAGAQTQEARAAAASAESVTESTADAGNEKAESAGEAVEEDREAASEAAEDELQE